MGGLVAKISYTHKTSDCLGDLDVFHHSPVKKFAAGAICKHRDILGRVAAGAFRENPLRCRKKVAGLMISGDKHARKALSKSL